MKVGDRVRHNGGEPAPERKGWEGTVTMSRGDTTHVDFDHQGKDYVVYTSNLEIIMTNTIDTTKPLVDEFNRPFTFITENSEGHILVSPDYADSCSRWLIFDKQGKFVRSEKGTGSTLTIKNKAVKTCEYCAVLPDGTLNADWNNRQTASSPALAC